MKSLVERIKDLEQHLAEQEEAQAALLLNQAEMEAKQAEQDEVLAALLLQGLEGGEGNV